MKQHEYEKELVRLNIFRFKKWELLAKASKQWHKDTNWDNKSFWEIIKYRFKNDLDDEIITLRSKFLDKEVEEYFIDKEKNKKR